MDAEPGEPGVFLIRVRSKRELGYARLLIDSIRSFGGSLSMCPIKECGGCAQRAYPEVGYGIEVPPSLLGGKHGRAVKTRISHNIQISYTFPSG